MINERKDAGKIYLVADIEDLISAGITINQLANKFMVDASTIRRWKSGKKVPGLFTCKEIARFLATTFEKDVVLGGCYHDGLAYSLAYDAHGTVELSGKTFTNLNTGLNGGAKAALLEHRRKFDPSRDIKQFIVALKPVEIISGLEDGECYKLLEDDICQRCDHARGICKIHDHEERQKDCLCDWSSDDDDYCGDCGLSVCRCDDSFCADCGELQENCVCDEECVCYGNNCICNDCLSEDDDYDNDDFDDGDYNMDFNEYGCYCNIEEDDDFCDMCSCRFDDDDDDDDDDQCGNDRCWCNTSSVGVVQPPLNAFARARWLKNQK